MLLEIVYFECPHCNKWFLKSDIVSYSVYGVHNCWSDGKCLDYTLPEYSTLPFTKCSSCNNFFWYDNGRQIYDYELREYERDEKLNTEREQLVKEFIKVNPDYEDDKKSQFILDYPSAEYWFELPMSFIKDLTALLEQRETLNSEREIYLRTKLFQHYNDLIRRESPVLQHLKHCHSIRDFFNFKPIQEQIILNKTNKALYLKLRNKLILNAQKLLELIEMEPEDEVDPLLKIELNRHLGKFYQARSLINELDGYQRNNNKKFIRKSKIRIKLRNSEIFRI